MNVTTVQASNIHELRGLEPDNLLAFLALLGLLRALEADKPDWHPRVAWQGDAPSAVLHLAVPALRHEVVQSANRGINRIGLVYEFDKLDPSFSMEEFRAMAKQAAHDGERSRLLAAIASDGALKHGSNEVEPTPFCAMFGQGHQHFLERLAKMANDQNDKQNEDALCRALFEVWEYKDDGDGFRWDPSEDRRYAYQFGDPSQGKNKFGTVIGANRLAAIGFGALTSAPMASGLATLGIVRWRTEQYAYWPLVAAPTSLAGHLALLAHPWLGFPQQAQALAPYGVRAVSRSRRYQVGKYFNFERARIQYL